MSNSKKVPELYAVDDVEKALPKKYRIKTYFPDLEGLAERVIWNMESNYLQCRVLTGIKRLFFVKIPRYEWINIGEIAPSIIGLTPFPAVAIYREYATHFEIIKKALEKTPFKVYLSNKSPTYQ